MIATKILAAGLALLLLFATAADAHESRPLYVQLTETNAGLFSVYWKVPVSMPLQALPSPVLPGACIPEAEPAMQQRGDAYELQQAFSCPDGLSGQQVGLYFPVMNPSMTSLFRVRLGNGEQHVRVLRPGEEHWTVPERESKLAVAAQYTRLGIEHIWVGIDHLLFVACLVLVAGTTRRLLITITGFTLAHSLTLALSALDVVQVPVPPVEAAIALSVVFLAYEIIRGDRSSLTFRFPVAVSVSFGLLHGFGFAAVLREIGLPQTELPTALLFFNAGVEIGQILFVAAVVLALLTVRLALGRSFRARLAGTARAVAIPAAYVIGGLASYWMIDRVAGFWA